MLPLLPPSSLEIIITNPNSLILSRLSLILTPLTIGLFRYFQLKQLPNFMLASPIVLLALYTILMITTHHRLWRRKPSHTKGSSSSELRTRARSNDWLEDWNISFEMIAHVLHLMVVLVVGVCIAHVQISTRLICSSCPIIYLGTV